jgi:hypothetical protein
VVGEQLLGLAGLSDVVVVLGLLRPDGVADDERDYDERDPAPDGLLGAGDAAAMRLAGAASAGAKCS